MAAGDLTTVHAVREFLQKPTADVDQDQVIQTLITAASAEIMRATSREFAPPVAGVARDFEYDPFTGLLSFGSYDLRTLTTVQIDVDEPSPTTLTADEYRLFPFPARDGVYSGLRLAPYVTRGHGQWLQRIIRVTGDWGFASVPAPVAQACAVTVAIWLRRDVSAFSTTFSIDEDRVERPEALPAEAWRLLDPYRREVYA